METRQTMTLEEVVQLLDRVVEETFIETNGFVDYKPENTSLSTNYYKVYILCQEALFGEDGIINIEEFYQKYLNGEFDGILSNINPIQNDEIDKAIQNKIAFKLTQMTNPLNIALAGLVEKFNTVVDSKIETFKDMTPAEINKLINGVGVIGEKFNLEKAMEILMSKKTPKKTSVKKDKTAE